MCGTIGGELDRHNGYGPGFDFLRLSLAMLVVIGHTGDILGIYNSLGDFEHFSGYWILSMFFSLSGFLVASSSTRLGLNDFLINRVLRIAPALTVEVLLSAFILGPIFTHLPLAAYFADGQVYQYTANIFGWITYELPGVFKTHPSFVVNISLWTIPFEYGFYGLLAFFMIFKVLDRPLLIVLSAVASIAIGLCLIILEKHGYNIQTEYGWYGHAVSAIFREAGSRLLVGVLLGTAFYLYRYRIPYDHRLFGICLCYCLVISFSNLAWWEQYLHVTPEMPVLSLIYALPITYVMAYIGVSRIPLPAILRRGDYSYGVYLYGYPLQQALYVVHPTPDYYALRLVVQAMLVLACAAFSWHAIEKPVLRLRQNFSFIARKRLDE